MDLIKATETLINYQSKLKQEVLDLRKLACEKAAIVRQIDDIVSSQDITNLQEHKKIEEAYSIKELDSIIFNKDK